MLSAMNHGTLNKRSVVSTINSLLNITSNTQLFPGLLDGMDPCVGRAVLNSSSNIELIKSPDVILDRMARLSCGN